MPIPPFYSKMRTHGALWNERFCAELTKEHLCVQEGGLPPVGGLFLKRLTFGGEGVADMGSRGFFEFPTKYSIKHSCALLVVLGRSKVCLGEQRYKNKYETVRR